MGDWLSFSRLWKVALIYFLLSSVYILGCGSLSFGFDRRPGTGLERPAAYHAAVLDDDVLLLTFTIGWAPNPGPYAPVTATNREGWGRLPLAELEWYGPDYGEYFQRVKHGAKRPVPTFSSDMSAYPNPAASLPVPILEFRNESGDIPYAGEYERFEAEAVARHEICLIRNGDLLTLIRHGDDHEPQFAFLSGPQRPYESWWATPLYVATYPARVVLLAGFVVLVAVVGMH